MPEIPLVITADTSGVIRVCGREVGRVPVPARTDDLIAAVLDAVADAFRDGLWREDDTLI